VRSDSIVEKIEEVIVQNFVQLRIALTGLTATDRKHPLDARIDKAFTQHPLPDHAGCAEQYDVHDLMKASSSALMVAASVVGMPCGKPL